MSDLYHDSSVITGELQPGKVVAFKRSLTLGQRLTVLGFVAAILASSTAFIWYVLGSLTFGSLSPLLVESLVLIFLLELIRLLQSLTLACFAFAAKDPVPLQPPKGLRVAVLTTIVPSKEPFPLVAQTLRAMKELEVPEGTKVDVWLLDESNSPAIRARCERLGVNYFSRAGLEGWNTRSGPYKARSKHGNHNAWRRAYERRYDVVTHLDPDHIPFPNFLQRTLGYFADTEVGFVVAPQLYGNLAQNWIARASAFQAYVFHGTIQRGGNGLHAPLFVGTNHLYRVKAFQQINGYQDSIIEDHLTSLTISAVKRQDGKRWKGIYTPDIVAVGEGPATFTDYFNQQKRWAYGIWDIVLRATPKHIRHLSRRQAIMFLMLQFFYPSVALSWLLSSVTTVLFSFAPLDFSGVASVAVVLWAYTLISSLGLFFWLRRFNLAEHERKSWGSGGIVLTMMCIPVYVNAGLRALLRRPLHFNVTAKGKLTSSDSLRTFRPHLFWLAYNGAALALIVAVGRSVMDVNGFWIIEHSLVCIAPPALFYAGRAAAFYRHLRQTGRQLTTLTPNPAHTLGGPQEKVGAAS